MHLDSAKLKQTLFLAALFALGGFLFWLLKGYLSSFLGAVVIYILLRPLHFFLTEKTKRRWPAVLSALLLMLLSFVVMVLPFFLLTVMLSSKVGYLINHYAEFLELAKTYTHRISETAGIDLLSQENIQRLTTAAAQILPAVLSATATAIADVAVLYFLLFFMLLDARSLEKTVRQHMPFDDENDQLLLSELKNMTMSNAVGVTLLAVLQAFFAWIGYLIFGVNEAFFWAVVTGLFSVVPLVGTAMVWVPLAVFQYFHAGMGPGVALGIYGALVITNVDNVFRFVLQKRIGNTHPLITFFGVLIGLPLFGVAGIVFGPLLIAYFLLLLKIYDKEYGSPQQEVTQR